jgi:hypothetical protein
MSNLIILLVLLWLPFLLFQRRASLITAFAATMLYIMNQLGLSQASDSNVLWLYLGMFAISMMSMILMKETK